MRRTAIAATPFRTGRTKTVASPQGFYRMVAVPVTALQNKSGLANLDSTDGPAPPLHYHSQRARHPPNPKLRLDFREIGFVPHFLRTRQYRPAGTCSS